MSETEFIVAFRPADSNGRFGIYWMDKDGRRELLASDPAISCNQPVPLVPRPVPPRPSTVDFRQMQAMYYLQDIYAGPGLAGVPRGTIKTLRVVAITFRAAGIGENGSHGLAGGALSSTPISIGNGAWDPKTVLGETKVYEDGSAAFQVPARTPVYFQALDEKGYAVQTMRSWSTAQPGERLGCVGCHESKNTTPRHAGGMPMAFRAGAEQLPGLDGSSRGFSFPRDIQPILDRHCTRCHHLPASVASERRGSSGEHARRGSPDPAEGPTEGLQSDKTPSLATSVRSGDRAPTAKRTPTPRRDHAPVNDEPAFSLLGREVADAVAKRRWSEAYLALTQSKPRSVEGGPVCFLGHPGEMVNWIDAQSVPTLLPPYFAGAAKSRLMRLLEEGHYGATLSREEMTRLACWIDLSVPYCGDYLEANAWSSEEKDRYERFEDKRRKMEQLERSNIDEWIVR